MPEAAERVLRKAYRSYGWVPITHGMSDATTYRLAGSDTLYVKLAEGMVAEAERIAWLSTARIAAPKVLGAGEAEGTEWLVTGLPIRPRCYEMSSR